MSERRTLRDMLDAVYAAERAYDAAVEATLPINSWVTVTSGERRTGAFVVGHRYGRVSVHNPDSGKTYSVYASRLVEHDTLRARAPEPRTEGGE